MRVDFDNTAIEILRQLGYKYYCNVEVTAPSLDPNEGLCAYWEMTPFKSKARG